MFDEYIKANSRPVRQRVQLKTILLVLVIWVASPLVVFALPADFPSIFPFVMLMVPLTGIGLILGFVIVLATRGWDPNPVMAILFVIVTCGAGLGAIYQGGAQLHLLTNGSRYEQIVDRIKSTADDKERERICGDDCFILSSDPLRVSFHYSHFFLSWTDIVYDQTGTLTDSDIDKRHRLNMYFISAERLRGDWYLGNFGD